MPIENKTKYRSSLKFFVLSIILVTITANAIIIFSEAHIKHYLSLLTLNITAAIASVLGIIAIFRYGFHGHHGKSYLFLTLGIIFWFSADFILFYNYSAGIKEQRLVNITDFLWFTGYGFLALHLFITLHYLNIKIKSKVVILVSIITTLFISYNIMNLLSYDYNIEDNYLSIIVTLLYPILDFLLIIPSSLILISLRKDFEHNIPWFLSSLSLLINSIADDGYVNDFVTGNSENFWFWELFYITDFILMSGALIWYNIFHISNTRT
ncbi:MAG: hypothetical protein AB7F53_07350, partial [Nitrososphaeraceae archaeon]